MLSNSGHPIDGQTVVGRSDRVAYQRIDDGGVLLHLDTGAYHRINGVGVLVWESLDRDMSVGEVVDIVKQSIDDPVPDEVLVDVGTFLTSMEARDLVVVRRD